jgi:ATP synthase mitochondrial F1 complex assembly factor 1
VDYLVRHLGLHKTPKSPRQSSMHACRTPILRHLAGESGAIRTRTQRRWAQVHDARLLATSQPVRSVIERYRDRLEEKARAEGHQDIEALKSSYADKIRSVRNKDVPPPAQSGSASEPVRKDLTTGTLTKPPPPPPPRQSANADATSVKPLDSILDLAKARTLPLPELTAIWRLRHASDPNSLCAVIPASTYKAMADAGRKYPHFVLPVPQQGEHGNKPNSDARSKKADEERGGEGVGAELHFLQWTFDPPSQTSTVLFTRLAEYKLRGEFAVPHTTVTHHVDLAADKGVVLMQGGVVEGRGVKAEEARWLVLCLQRFYGGWDGAGDKAEGARGHGLKRREVKGVPQERMAERKKLLEWFGSGDERFSVERLLEEAQRMP